MALTESEQTGADRATDQPVAPPRQRRLPGARPGALPGALAAVVPFAAVLGVLLFRNAFLFSTPLYEDADMGANSILIEQARRFTLLVGHYSREGFNHPGPAFLYVQAWGEQLFWAALRVVPAAWNGQLLAVYALNAGWAALTVVVCYRWTRSLRSAAACLAVLLALAAVRPEVVSSDWMPYLLVPAFLTFGVAASSVAAGRVRDGWIAALAGWFLVNGNVAFLFFVPLLAAAAVAALAWPHRGRLRPALRDFRRNQRAAWLPVALISAVFAFPIALTTALHWPGQFGKYLSYSASSHPGSHSASQLAGYVLWFWWPGRLAWLVPPLLFLVAGAVTWRLTARPVRRLAVSLLAFAALTSAAFVGYAVAGIDELDLAGRYIGYFFWSVPVALVLVIALGLAEALPAALRSIPLLPSRRVTAAALTATAAALACTAFAVAPLTKTSTDHVDPIPPAISGASTDPALAAVTAGLAAQAGGRPVVLRLDHNAWPAMTGLLVQAERTGVTVCLADPRWAFMVTSQLICTPAELATGRSFWLNAPGAVRRGMPVLYRLRRGIVTAGTKST